MRLATLISVEQVAGMLGISRSAAYRIEAGRVKVGRSVCWTLGAIEALLPETDPEAGVGDPAMQQQPALLRVADLAALLGTTDTQVRNMRARGQLPDPVKAPEFRLCWRRVDVDRWLDKLGQ